MAGEDLICIAEEFSEWLEDVAEKYHVDKDEIQEIIKRFLMWGKRMTREEKENLLRKAVDILIKLDNHLMTSRDNAEFSSWVEDLIDNSRCEERE